jgi:FAD/FMN-containing dehydrogenase
MSKVAHYLQEHLVGEVITASDARLYFSTDNSILQQAPTLVVYPRNENDIRKTARFSWQLAERGRTIPITARGAGTDETGGAIGTGIVLVFPAHMNRILELDKKSHTVTVEPGIVYGKLQQTLQTHERFLPPYPASIEYSTVGGAISKNTVGEKSVKYGDTKSYVKSLRVVLANGEVIETKRLSKRELSKKLGLATFEGEIYRSLDTLLEEQHDELQLLARGTVRNNAGYNLLDIKRKDGSFDLSPLMAGSQGTLGVITEAVLKTEPYNPKTTLVVGYFDSIQHLQQAIVELNELAKKPSTIELVDGHSLQQIHELNPNQLKEVLKPPFPEFTLLIEFDDPDRQVKKLSKKAVKILEKYAKSHDETSDPEVQLQYWKLRQTANTIVAHNEGLIHSVPLFDGGVPLERIREYIEGVYKLLSVNNVKPGLWGPIGEGILHFRPKLNLGHVGDRQKAFRLLDEFSKLVLSLGGTISASAGDGRLKAPYLETMYGDQAYTLLTKVKQIFDPYSILNPGVKFNTTEEDLKAAVRSEYDLNHLYSYLPRA